MKATEMENRLASWAGPLVIAPVVRFVALLLLCSAYIQGPLAKILDFPGAIGEMNHFGLTPAPFFAVGVIAFELSASAMILTGFLRWLAALALSAFTLMATFLAFRFWELPAGGQERLMTTNGFFEHLGLAGAFLLVAWYDLHARTVSGRVGTP